MSNPYSAYKKQSVSTMTPVEVVIKLYSETERQLAIGAIESKDIKKAHEALMKAQELIGALRGSLDKDVPISKNLDQLYDFFQRSAANANLNKDAEHAEELKKIIPMIADLRDAFTQISQMTKEEIEAQAKGHKK